MRLSKQAVLHISEIYEFSKIIEYFKYLKAQNFAPKMRGYLDKIEIPASIEQIDQYFDENGEFKESIDERLVSINEAYKNKKRQIDESLKKLIYTKSLSKHDKPLLLWVSLRQSNGLSRI